MNAFKAFKAILDVHGISKPRLIATSAVRDAKNAASFVSLVSQTFNWEVDIITGLEEAKLIYKGVRQCYDFRDAAVIMDIGGGSTEFIVADNKGIQKEVSLNIGVSRLYQGFEVSDPFCDNDIRNIENFLEERDQGFFDNITARTLIGSSGTFETFYELINQMPFPKSSKTIELELEPFIEALDALIYSTLTERNKNKFIIPIRKQMAPFAAVKTKWVMQKLQPERVLISPYSLKEGAFI
jgi:exopolyphosphatase/guanosine-5'-triphosphate,3'-diphosphate pyrophosphatase